MKITHHANACFSLIHKSQHILFDPWMNGPAVAQGWTCFPPAINKIEDLPKPDLVYISHIHSDHCEVTTMAGIPRNTPIIIMDLGPNFLFKMLKSDGFTDITLLKNKVKSKVEAIDNLYAEPFPATFGHICANVIDSGIVLELDGVVIINSNDNKPSEDLCRYLKKKYNGIDLALLPCGGGGGYPAMYDNLSVKKKREIVKKNNTTYESIFSAAIDILKPRVAIPVAGGYAIRGPYAATANWYQNRSLNHNEVITYHKKNGTYQDTKILPVQPGLEVDIIKKEITNGQYKPWDKEDLKTFFRELANIKIEPKIKTQGKIPCLTRLLITARKNLWERQKSNYMTPTYFIYLENSTTGQVFELPLHENRLGEVTNHGQSKKTPYLKMTLNQDTLMEWLLGYEDFNMLDSGHRISFYREPNEYIVEPYYLMSLFRL